MTKITSLLLKNIAIISTIAMFFIDRYFKLLALNGAEEVIIPGLLSFNLHKNYNIAFSLNMGGDWIKFLILGIVIGILTLILVKLKKEGRFSLDNLLLTILLFGAINNLWDRFEFGYVIDYLNFYNLNVFNISDIIISFACLILILRSASLNPYVQKF